MAFYAAHRCGISNVLHLLLTPSEQGRVNKQEGAKEMKLSHKMIAGPSGHPAGCGFPLTALPIWKSMTGLGT